MLGHLLQNAFEPPRTVLESSPARFEVPDLGLKKKPVCPAFIHGESLLLHGHFHIQSCTVQDGLHGKAWGEWNP